MHDALRHALPIVTLLLGAGLANFLKVSELRKPLRLDAADQLVELPALPWNKTEPQRVAEDERGGEPPVDQAESGRRAPGPDGGHAPSRSGRASTLSARTIRRRLVGRGRSDETWTEVSAVVAELLGTNRRIRSYLEGPRKRMPDPIVSRSECVRV